MQQLSQHQQQMMNYRNAVQGSQPGTQQQSGQLSGQQGGGQSGLNANGAIGSRFSQPSMSSIQSVFNDFYPSNNGGNVNGNSAVWSSQVQQSQQPAQHKKIHHRNTMPSLAISPFAFNAQTSQNHVELPSSLNCHLVQFTSGRTDTYYVPSNCHDLSVSIGDYVVVEADRGEDLGRVIMDNINVALPRRNSVSSYATSSGSGSTNGMYGGEFSSLLPSEYGVYGSGGSQSSSSNPSPTFELEECISSSNVFSSSNNNNNNGNGSSVPVAPPQNMPKKIYRVAVAVEVESLLAKVRDEMNAIAVAQYKVQEWKLPMVVIDAEYQWDRRKLTFFFSVTIPQYYPNQPSPRIDFRTLVRDLYQIYRTRIWMYCVDKDKNRANRVHLREKFLKGLYASTGATATPSHRSSAPASNPSSNDENNGGYSNSYSSNSAPGSYSNNSSSSNCQNVNNPTVKKTKEVCTNSLKAVLEEVSFDHEGETEWDISEVFKMQQSPLYNKKMLQLGGDGSKFQLFPRMQQLQDGHLNMNGGGIQAHIDALEFGMSNMGFGQVGSNGGGGSSANLSANGNVGSIIAKNE